MANREGQPNPDAAIVEAALEKHVPMISDARVRIWNLLHRDGASANRIAEQYQKVLPAFAQALREGIAARRGQRFGGHGGKG